MARERIATWPSDRASRLSVKPTETLTGNRTLTLDEVERYNAVAFDPGGATPRTVTLPAESACEGVYLFISNKADAAEVLNIVNDAAGAVTTVAQNESALVWCDGTIWSALTGAVNS